MPDPFECSGCALCCRHLAKAIENVKAWDWAKKAADEFPYKALADGECEMLVDNRCSVYETRPLLCDIERAADELDLPFSKAEWFRLNAMACNSAIDEAGLAEIFKVRVDYN